MCVHLLILFNFLCFRVSMVGVFISLVRLFPSILFIYFLKLSPLSLDRHSMLNTAVFSSTLSAPYPQCHSEELCSCQEPPQHPLMKNLCLRTGAPVQQTTGERLASRRRTDTKPTLGRLGSKPEQLCDKQHPRGEKAPSWHVFFLADLQENTVSLDREPGRLGEHSVLTSCLSD